MSETNGTPVQHITRDMVLEARRKLAYERANIQLQRLSSTKKLLEATTSSEYWVNSVWARLDRYRSEPDFPFSSAYDRRHGRNFPIFQTEDELSQLRMQSRIITTVNSYAGGLLEGLCSYVISTGYTYRATSKRKEQPAPESLLTAIQDIIDDFIERNGWYGAWEPGREEELFFRQFVDGEYFIRFFAHPREKDRLILRAVEPDQVRHPQGEYGQEASFGILTPEDDTETHLKYWVTYLTGEQNAAVGQWVENGTAAGQMKHARRFVTRNVKRGLPFFGFDTMDALHIGSRLRRNMSMGAAIQACIAGVRQHSNATKEDVEGLQDLVSEYTFANPRTGRTEHVQKHEPGITDVPKGQEWVNPPSAQNAAAHVQILQACLRGAGVRINAPEWIVSADASNNNYASSMTAESPWVRQVLRQQRGIKETNRSIMWAAVEHYVKVHGGLTVRVATASGGLTEQTFGLKDIRKLVDIQAEAPTPETRDKLQEAQVNQIYRGIQVKSPQTIQQELSLDTEQEKINQQKWNEEMGQQGAPLDTADPGAKTGGGPAAPPDDVQGGDAATSGGTDAGRLMDPFAESRDVSEVRLLSLAKAFWQEQLNA